MVAAPQPSPGDCDGRLTSHPFSPSHLLPPGSEDPALSEGQIFFQEKPEIQISM